MFDCFLEGGGLPMLAFLMQIGASLQHLSYADTQKSPQQHLWLPSTACGELFLVLPALVLHQ